MANEEPCRAAGTRVLIANEPRSYREAIAAAIRRLRPRVEVILVEPDELDAGVERLRPALVVCSRATGRVERGVPAWIELYPDLGSRSVVSAGGERSTVEDMGLPDLLRVVDRVTGDV